MIRSLPFFISKRYLFSQKSHHVINIISWISLGGISIGALALVVILSVFNGFESLIESLVNSFDPNLKITIAEGKTFSIENSAIDSVLALEEIENYSIVIEEQALFEYNNRQHFAYIKGVDKNFNSVTGVDSMIIYGDYILKNGESNFGVFGMGVANILGVNVESTEPVKVYLPKANTGFSMNPENSFNKGYIYPRGIFSIQNELDTKYVIVPISFAREMLGFEKKISAIEIKLPNQISSYERDDIQNRIKDMLGNAYHVKNRYEQQELLYKILKTEKWAIFMILAFILLIASFNIIGSLTMLIIEKKNDIKSLEFLGADKKLIRRIFLYEGLMISIGGALVGMFLGALICWMQMEFSLLSFPHSTIINAYPVKMIAGDFAVVFLLVLFIGFLTSSYPVRFITGRYISEY